MLKKYVWPFLKASESIVGLNHRNFRLIYKLNNLFDYQLANDKIKAKDFLNCIKVPTSQTYQIYRGLYDLRNIVDDLKNYASFVVKPAKGSRGNGILILEQSEKGKYRSLSGKQYNPSELKYFIASIIFGKFSMGHQDHALIEKKLIPDSRIRALSYGGFADIRILFAREKLILAMLRLPTKTSDGKANLHQGGIGVGVDLKSGITTQAIFKNHLITKHPDIDAPLIGVQIPDWHRLIKISNLIAQKCPLKYIGIDLILEENDGPVVIEFNARPGLEIQNANQIGILEHL